MPANLNAPFGLRPMRYRSGAPYNGAVNPYSIGTGDGTALFLGDPVMFAADSNAAAQGDGRHQPGSLPIITRAATTGVAVGVVCGVEWVTRDSLTYRPASTAAVIYVADDPDIVFWCQDDGAGTPGAGNAGINANFTFATAGSVVSGRSGAALNGATWAATQAFQAHVIGLARLPNNDVAFDFATWEVTLNTHQYQGSAAGTTLGIA